jgi:hypothetical protein
VSLPARVHAVPAEDMPEGPVVVVDEPDSARAVVERLRDPRAGRPPALLVRVAAMNSPDRIAVRRAEERGRRVELEVELRAFSGPLLANLPTLAVVEVGPLTMGPGPAEVALRLHTLPFAEIDRPEQAGPATTSATVLTVAV